MIFKTVSVIVAVVSGLMVYAISKPGNALGLGASERTSVRYDNGTIHLAREHRRKGRRRGRMMKRKSKAPYAFFEAKGLFATGLEPNFPDGVNCPTISSPYGSQTRYDGSQRNNQFHNYHNGMDITLEPGTPLLAVTDGTVVHKGTAGRLVGNYIWLHFPPEATKLSIHVFARYQHLDEPSSLKVGDAVKLGDTVGLGGATGTTGGHFGSSGYSHLHLVLSTGPSAEHRVKPGASRINHDVMKFFDPMGLYLGRSLGAVTNHALRDLPRDKKKVPVAVRTRDGRTIPDGARVIWPLACK